ncbi:MAG: MSMEG_0568 family radical SAM protein [Candidatus Hadarchaeales archaeon]
MELRKLELSLLSLGARSRGIYRGRKGGAGPSGGRCMIFPDGVVLNVPLRGNFVSRSPFELREGWIWRGEERLVQVSLLPLPKFYRKKTSDGIPMHRVAKLHGRDCLATTLLSSCWRWAQGKACKFCAIQVYGEKDPLIRKTPEQLVEVAKAALEEGLVKHLLITTGTLATPDRGARVLAETVRKIREKVDLPTEVHLEPPEDPESLEELKEAGVDTVGMHLEFYDERVRRRVCPGKAEVPREQYFRRWREAVEIFGKWQVNSFLLIGLGESHMSLVEGVRAMLEMGVFPRPVPFRPTPGTPLGEVSPPKPSTLEKLLSEVEGEYRRAGALSAHIKSGCARCRACGLDALLKL